MIFSDDVDEPRFAIISYHYTRHELSWPKVCRHFNGQHDARGNFSAPRSPARGLCLLIRKVDRVDYYKLLLSLELANECADI